MFLTIHSLGTSYTSWLHFALDPCMEDIRKRSAGMTLYYLSAPRIPMTLYLQVSVPARVPAWPGGWQP